MGQKNCTNGNNYFGANFVDSISGDCDYCLCYCDAVDSKTDRIISLQKQESNITENKVITGMRVVKLGQVFFIQIQVGKLLTRQRIDQKSVEWVKIKPIENISYTSDGPDYFIMRRNTPMDMDILKFKHNEVVTGK